MSSPPALRLWVGTLVVMLVAEPPGALQKCIFDEVQAQVRVVRAAGQNPNGPPDEPTPAPPTGPRHQRSSLGEMTPFLSCLASANQDPHLDSERERPPIRSREGETGGSSGGGCEGGVVFTVRVVGPLLLSRDMNKYCKFIWSNSRTSNYNRCGRANNNYRNETCLDVTIPDQHLSGCDIYPEPDSPIRTVLRSAGAGLPDTDFLLYLHTQSTDKCRAEPSVLAYAAHCQTDAQGRPVAGVVVICRDRLSEAAYNHQVTVQAVIHELFHALGFSRDLYHTWKDCSSSSPALGSGCSPRGKVVHSDGSGQMMIYTSSVLSALQMHLTSSDPELGGPLENLVLQLLTFHSDFHGRPRRLFQTSDSFLQDAPGRASSHWEARVLRGSIMAAELEDPATVRIDPVTLAALQDTGWYRVELSRAQSLVWGDGEGASFGSLSTCQHNSSSFFCTGSGLGCHFLHLHKGECQTDPYLEGCRVFKPLKNSSECWKKENTRPMPELDWSGEIWGLGSRCFSSNLTRQMQFLESSGSVEGRCYRHRCTGPNRYQIQVSGSDWVTCPPGGAIQINGYQGLVFCPDRRLCRYPDISPPSDDDGGFPPSNTSDPDGMMNPAQEDGGSSLRPHTELSVASALGFTAALCLLAALALSYRKCRSCRNRVRSVPDDHSDL